MKKGEDPVETVKREAIEEIGFSLNVGEFIGKAEKHWVSPQYSTLSQHNIGYFYVCTLADKIAVPLEKEPMRWVSLEIVEENLFHEHHLYMLKKTLH
ncbi:NUDIX domain-containing protein [Candidatus Enterococcus ikei]|uniref:NUDIX domain-containing protein n=1 Tax=Candidatus Enterococcus ikei TaxID=2815326 RepID=A0ABS3GZK2_9ENTE|nr:NUDIX domain-containing protein [Enterococcus sp. DIV0869a]